MTFLVVDNRLLDHPDTGMHGILLGTLERRYYTTASVFCIPVGQEVLAPASGVRGPRRRLDGPHRARHYVG